MTKQAARTTCPAWHSIRARNKTPQQLEPFLHRPRRGENKNGGSITCAMPGSKWSGAPSAASLQNAGPSRTGKYAPYRIPRGVPPGLYALLASRAESLSSESQYLLVRSFNPDCLLTRSGESVIDALLGYCDCVLIEDADLRPHDLVEHVRQQVRRPMAIEDVSRTLGLVSNRAYFVRRDSDVKADAALGKRIW